MPVKSTKPKTTTVKTADPETPRSAHLLAALPDPEDLARYEKIVPGSANRILELAERQASSRLKFHKLATIGGFIPILLAGALGGILLLTGSELAGLMIVLADIAACAWLKSSNHNQNQ